MPESVAPSCALLVHLWFLSWGTDELQGSTFMMVGMMAIRIPGQGAMDWTPIFGHVAAVTSVFLMDVLALSWVGMWLAMRSRSLNQALFKTFVWVIVIPWFVMTFVWMTLMFSGRFSPDQALLRTLAHAVPLLLKDVIFIGWARSRLLTRFRAAAAESLPVRSPSACKESLPTPARKDCEEFSRDGQNFIPH